MAKRTPPYQDTPASAAYMRRRDRCQMAFESGDGREIPTEAITQGLFWEALAWARLLAASPPSYEVGKNVADWLAKLEPQK